MTKDPVCGMTIEPTQATARAGYGGKTYYFCSAHCQHTFQADPTKYAALSSQ